VLSSQTSSVCILRADLKLNQWNKALDDCEAVLAIEATNLKGLFLPVSCIVVLYLICFKKKLVLFDLMRNKSCEINVTILCSIEVNTLEYDN